MSEFIHAKRTATALVALGTLISGSGCFNEPARIHEHIMAEPDCADNPNDVEKTTFEYIEPGETILAGNTRTDSGNGLSGDIAITVDENGKVMVSETERDDIKEQGPKTSHEDGKEHVVTGDEVYVISAAPTETENNFAVTIVGSCVNRDQ